MEDEQVVERFTDKDPIGFAGGNTNLYAYVTNDPVNETDSYGLWKDPGHRMLTTAPMQIVKGFTASEIAIATTANLNVDRLSNAKNDPAHYMPDTRDAAEAIIAGMFETAVRLEIIGRHQEAMEALGAGAHTLQDRFAHYEQDAGWGAHATGGKCDDPSSRPDQFSSGMNSSTRYFRNFLVRTGRASLVGY